MRPASAPERTRHRMCLRATLNAGLCLRLVRYSFRFVLCALLSTIIPSHASFCSLKSLITSLQPLLPPPSTLSLYLPTSPQYVLTMLAASSLSCPLVPIYTTSPVATIKHVLGETSPRAILVHPTLLSNLLKALEGLPGLDPTLILLSSHSSPLPYKTLLFQTLLTSPPTQPTLPPPNTTAIICYTSGTTSLPKGVCLTHSNLSFTLQSLLTRPGVKLGQGAVHLSYLPIQHIFETLLTLGFVSTGGRVAFVRYQPDPKKQGETLTEDMQAAGPTVWVAVPRVLEKVAVALKAKVRERAEVSGKERRSFK